MAGATGLGSGPVWAQSNAQASPAQNGSVVDRANLIGPAAEAAIVARLAALEADTSDLVMVITLPDLKGETIEAAGMRLGNSLGSGPKNLNNWVLLVLALKERQARIEVGEGLEGLLPSSRAARIIQLMVPQFKAQKYEAGLVLGVEEISKRLRSDRRRPQRLEPSEKAEG